MEGVEGEGSTYAANAAYSHPELNKLGATGPFTRQKSKHPLISSFQVNPQKYLVTSLSWLPTEKSQQGLWAFGDEMFHLYVPQGPLTHPAPAAPLLLQLHHL